MGRLIVLMLVVFAILLHSCSSFFSQDRLSPTWEAHGLHEASVHSIGERDGKLYVGSDQGVYISKPSDYSSWRGPELDIEGIQYITLALDPRQKIVAAVHYFPDYFEEENQVLFESHDDGETWDVIEARAEGLVRYGEPVTSFMTMRFLEPQTGDLRTLLGYSGVISRTEDGGQNWEVVFSGGHLAFLKVSSDHPDHFWAGGRVTIGGPYLATSRDGGETWTDLTQHIPFQFGPSLAAAVYPRDPNVVLVSFGAVRKTENSGRIWKTKLDDAFVFTIKNGLKSSDKVYASGIHPSSRLSVSVSDDYGASWTTYVYEDGPRQIRVFDMAVADIDGQEVVFLGTNKGVYSFRLSK